MSCSHKSKRSMRAAMPAGIGFNRHFLADGDDTAAGAGCVGRVWMSVSPSILAPFEHAAHFSTYPFEFHISPVVTAKAAHALRTCGYDAARWQEPLSARNMQTVYGKRQVEYVPPVWLQHRPHGVAWRILSSSQTRCRHSLDCYPTQGWRLGQQCQADYIETAFAVLGLYTLARDDLLDDAGWDALWRGHQMLLAQWQARGWLTKGMDLQGTVQPTTD